MLAFHFLLFAEEGLPGGMFLFSFLSVMLLFFPFPRNNGMAERQMSNFSKRRFGHRQRDWFRGITVRLCVLICQYCGEKGVDIGSVSLIFLIFFFICASLRVIIVLVWTPRGPLLGTHTCLGARGSSNASHIHSFLWREYSGPDFFSDGYLVSPLCCSARL